MARIPNIWLLSVERDEHEWCLTTVTDGQRRVISRHPTEADAEAAKAVMNAASFPGTGGSNDPQRALDQSD